MMSENNFVLVDPERRPVALGRPLIPLPPETGAPLVSDCALVKFNLQTQQLIREEVKKQLAETQKGWKSMIISGGAGAFVLYGITRMFGRSQ